MVARLNETSRPTVLAVPHTTYAVEPLMAIALKSLSFEFPETYVLYAMLA
jgi:hypothetical protein